MRQLILTIVFLTQLLDIQAQSKEIIPLYIQDELERFIEYAGNKESGKYNYLHNYYEKNDIIPLPTTIIQVEFDDTSSLITKHIIENQFQYQSIIRQKHADLNILWCNHHAFMQDVNEIRDMKELPEIASTLIYSRSQFKKRYNDKDGNKGWWAIPYQIAKKYDLSISSYFDERYNLISSTEICFDYINHLHNNYGDWDLTFIAFAFGPEKLQKELFRNNLTISAENAKSILGESEFEKLCFSIYMGKLFDQLRPEFPIVDESGFYEKVFVRQPLHMEQIASALDANLETIKELNPTFKAGYVPLHHDSIFYLLTADEKDSVLASFSYSTILLEPKVALEFSGKPTDIYSYKRDLYFPPADTNFYPLGDPKKSAYPGKKLVYYKVRKGDYLGKIARKYKVRVKDIQKWNRLRGTNIREGQRLKIYVR